VDALVNGSSTSSFANYWKSQQTCLVPYGGGFCGTEFEFAIAGDGTARWQEGTGNGAGCGGKGETTWTKLGPAAFSMNNVSNGNSLTITSVDGSIRDGFFDGDVSSYPQDRLTGQTEQVPGF
jgi:hypothetical protein